MTKLCLELKWFAHKLQRSIEHNTALLFPKVLIIKWVYICWRLFSFIIFLSLSYTFISSPLKKSSPVFLFQKDSFSGLQTWMWGCIKHFPMKPRKQIKMWLWEIAPVKHNSRTGQIRHFLFLWGDSHCQGWKWWSADFCEKRLMHLECLGENWPYVCINFVIIF